jgi:hypothetical protein
VISVACALALTVACATEGTSGPAPTQATVQALIGDAACDADAQCATVGVGAKACGGPSSYLAWSSLRTDGGELRAAAERHAAAQRKEIEAKAMMSNCAVTPDPGAYCDLGRAAAGAGAAPTGVCRTRSHRAGGAAVR